MTDADKVGRALHWPTFFWRLCRRGVPWRQAWQLTHLWVWGK